ncbi:MAG: segregation/condensation protein A [Syntrophobacterales bacterium]|jgi:segregation and condensation protein A|nr:segregation/condensation protein A [Syntrophobacterales bacterium]
MDYEIRLDQFQGPLDLLLFLIRKNKIDIYDIPIAHIAGQYWEYMEIIQALDLDKAGEYLVLAATLLHLKSRMLLPVPKDEEQGGEEEDPRAELVRHLLEHQVLKNVVSVLESRSLLERDVFKRGFHDEGEKTFPEGQLAEMGVFDLIEALAKVITESRGTKQLEIDLEKISLADRINEIMEILAENKTVGFYDLFGDTPITKKQIVYTFLSILELTRLRMIRVFQDLSSGVIQIFLVEAGKHQAEYGAA